MGKCVQKKTAEVSRPPGPLKFKFSDRVLYLSTPKHIRAKHDEWYLKSFDTFYTKGKKSKNEKKSIRGESYECSERTVTLSEPKRKGRKYKPRRPIYYHTVPKAAREAEAKPEIVALSVPHKWTLLFSKQRLEDLKIPKEKIDKIDELIKESGEELSPEMEAHFQKPPKEKKWAAGDQALKDSVERLSAPKKQRPRPRPPVRKRMPLDSLLVRIVDVLYAPRKPDVYDPTYGFRVSPLALTYEITDTVTALAAPKQDMSGERYIPGQINPFALTYVATENMIKLATPRAKAAVTDLDVKENPFGVEPTALTYRATARILNLAKPRGG